MTYSQKALSLAQNSLKESAEIMAKAFNEAETLLKAAYMVAEAIAEGNKILIFGNGGSAAEAQHFVAEFVGRFLIERPALPAIALTTDTSILTAVGNDYGFEEIFARQVSALAAPGDIVWGISTSGTSKNVLKALETASNLEAKTILMCGAELPSNFQADLFITTPKAITPKIQELHLAYGHIICDLTDYLLFEEVGALNIEEDEVEVEDEARG